MTEQSKFIYYSCQYYGTTMPNTGVVIQQWNCGS
jgi:hypothetical protein